MDEPFQNLDSQCKKLAINLYRALQAQSNINFIFVSHNIDEAVKIADDILFLSGDKNKGSHFYEDGKAFKVQL